jgi:hypothetical protein
MLTIAGAVAGAVAAPPPPVKPRPEPPAPKIVAGFRSSNIFWPGEQDAQGTVIACTYIPTLVFANHSRLIAHGSCTTEPGDCNGFHVDEARGGRAVAARAREGGNPVVRGMVCQKHSDDMGKTWSQIRVAMRGVYCGQIVWDDLRRMIVAHYSGTNALGHAWNGATIEYKSTDLGETWSSPRCLTISNQSGAHGATIPLCANPATSTRIQGGTPTGDGGNSIWTSAGAGLQLSPSNKYHPHRLLFTGHVNGCQQWWYSDVRTLPCRRERELAGRLTADSVPVVFRMV